MLLKKIFLFLAVILSVIPAIAQQFGATPSGIKWKQINTDTFRIIYPAGQDSIAQHIAAITRLEQQKYAGTLGNAVHKINIVLRNKLTYFNGYVSLGPYRSEYYLLPQQNAFELGAQSAAGLLAVHEYRHVEQYSNFRKGLSKTAYILFGENGQALANNAAVPNWFFEGDAVYNETELTKQGRGTLPYFYNGYKALYMDGKQYTFMKLRNGSFKDFVPDHYPLGYMLVAYGREKYGMDIWKKITEDAVRFKPLIYPWQGAVKRHTGIMYRRFVRDAFTYYRQQWKTEKTPAVDWVSKLQKNNVINYQYPYKTDDGAVMVLKNSYKTVPAFYKIYTDGREQKIAAQSITNDDYFSFNHNTIIYAAYQPDMRWGYRQYSVIKTVNVATGKEQKITTRTRYFSPDIAHDGSKIAAVALLPNQQSTLDILDKNGDKLFAFTNDSNYVYSYPKFAQDDRSIFVMLRKPTGEMSLQQLDIETKDKRTILPFANRMLGFPSVQGDTLLYSITGNARDEVHAYIVSQQRAYKLAGYPTGLYGAALMQDGKIISTTQTADGKRLGAWQAAWQPVTKNNTLTRLYVPLPAIPTADSTITNVEPAQYPTSGYHKWSNPFNLHSWQPDYADPLFTFTIYGENILSTVQTRLYYQYNTVEKYHQAGTDFLYGGWYVEPFINFSETFNRKAYSDSNILQTWNEWNAGTGLRLPLNLSGGRQNRYITTAASYNVRGIQFTGAAKEKWTNGYYNIIQTSLNYIGQRQQAVQHIFPRWAQTFSAQYRTLAESKKAYQLLLSGALYLPGILKAHSLVLNAAYQTSDTLSNYRFSSSFPFSRGYNFIQDRVYPNMYKLGVNYHFPLCYPDWGFGNIVYFRRIRANVFFDYTQLRTNNAKRYRPSFNFKTAGAELYVDTRWWNEQSITIGIRYSRLLDTKYIAQSPNQWTLILPDSIFE
ncbi:hypothetical protein FC093_14010 [Ilyomonas limi]|uniref:Uncharacterized protein n=1 Tax=Ilyomonas limi TaxID=2575867 RepID=A0A4U3KXP2_9BACT|nr:hypothetical protein [Ilyomonas limi]TKK67411.1 hypothetical protein FC093_14010 [Ilyomonas limi]